MSSHRPSTSPATRRRRALEERSSAHTNERSPTRSLRRVRTQEDVDDVYTATPFPTKPEQILLPIPGKGQQNYIADTGFSYSNAVPSTSTWSSPTFTHATGSSPRQHSIGEWDASTVDAGNSPPAMWDEDPTSSKSSLPEIIAKPEDLLSDESEAEFSDDDLIVLPTATPTIKAVVSEPPTSPKSQHADDESAMGYSSPNIEQIGAPSSPNFVTLDNSSGSFLPRGRTINLDSDPRSNSLSSYQSGGTVVRHPGAAPWFFTASSEQLNGSRSPSFRSSPPVQSIASFRTSSRQASASRSRSATSSSRSLRSVSDMVSDIQAAIDSGVPIQYPRIRAPSSSSSRAETFVSSDRDFTPGPASGRWNPHLSRVSSVWSGEEYPDPTTSEEEFSSEGSEPVNSSGVLDSENSKSTVWLVGDTEADEHLDSLTNLPTRNGFTYSLSSSSKRSNSQRSNSMRSLKRPGTGTSGILHILPTWAKIYYRADSLGFHPTLSMMEPIRQPSTRPPTSNSSVFNLMPHPLNVARPRSPDPPRSPERVQFAQRRIESDPLDPRAHWVPSPEPEDSELVGSGRYRLRHSWSPHLYKDRRTIPRSGSGWTSPSFDSTTEPVFGRRNIQVYSFCLGFIFPLAWIIASFLPLPYQPKDGEMIETDDEVEMALECQLLDLQQRRYNNARWWRNLNRWMISLGVVIIVIIITLAAIGTTTGF
ncbi:hypothetical protein N7493_007184 [Penicillium malachiteum]|uniref:Serine-rich protein n=1 Tax=Penicillium malachiteum TaxID=1324776 RepID=A0AAD6MUP9_9EURO|nr:hypothetical protein N7493_007184 [Penicillium malachiteum]